jgi:hypothetical protein
MCSAVSCWLLLPFHIHFVSSLHTKVFARPLVKLGNTSDAELLKIAEQRQLRIQKEEAYRATRIFKFLVFLKIIRKDY